MSRIYWDTMLFVYWLEDHPRYAKRVRHILSKMKERQDQLCTSSFTVGEILVGPYKMGASETTRQLREVFKAPFVEVIPYTIETADLYAGIRAQQGVSPADSIHLACAAQAHARNREPERAGEVECLRCDNSKALAMGWKPTIKFFCHRYFATGSRH